MATTLVVDGYNAINAIDRIRKILIAGQLERARKELMAICREYARSSGYITDVRVVFDGDDKYRQMEEEDRLRVKDQVFSASGEGDDEIIRTVKRYSSYSRVIVVSNDNYIKNMSRGYGASSMSPEEMVQKKGKGKKKKEKGPGKKISREQQDKITEEYMNELGLD